MAGSYKVSVYGPLPSSSFSGLTDFLETHYLTPNMRFMQGGSYNKGGDSHRREYAWTLDPASSSDLMLPIGFPRLAINLVISLEGVEAEFSGFDKAERRVVPVCDHIADNIEVLVTSFMDHAKKTSLHFVFSVGRTTADGAVGGTKDVRRDIMKRIFAGNTMNLYLLLMVVSFILIISLGGNAIFAILAVQAVALVFSDRLMTSAGGVRVTEKDQEVAVVSVACSPQVLKSLSRQGRKVLPGMRAAMEAAISKGVLTGPETKTAVYQVLGQVGVDCSQDDVRVTTRNPYALVKGVAEKFRLPVPKIVMVNSPVDNAAATGVSPKRASITITAGALEDLSDAELEAVVGHEFGHIKGRDPIILFAVTMVMYLGGIFLWLPVLIELGLFYFLVAFSVVYTVGKVLETRADTESVAVLGRPSLLASALTRIGFTQLYYEKYSPRIRFFDWFRFDPHPPIYFRVKRLSSMARKGGIVSHTLLVSIRDCISGFFGSLAAAG